LLEIWALSDTLILDEDGIHDPAHFRSGGTHYGAA
jgi:hypothetical protein